MEISANLVSKLHGLLTHFISIDLTVNEGLRASRCVVCNAVSQVELLPRRLDEITHYPGCVLITIRDLREELENVLPNSK